MNEAPLDKLRDVQAHRRTLDMLERLAVIEARAEGATWTQIGRACSMARTNAHRKFGKLPQARKVEA